MPTRITSQANALVRRAGALAAEGSARRLEGAFLAEGVRLIDEALAAGASIEIVFHSPRLSVTARGRQLLARLRSERLHLVETTDAVLDRIAPAETPQGIVAIIRFAPAPLPHPEERGEDFWVLAWGLQDPGNLGTLLRSADAAGASLFATVAGTVDPTSPKAVRASAGSIFRMPLAPGLPPDDLLDLALARGVRLFGTAPAGGAPYHAQDYRGALGFVFGREGEGLPPLVAARLHTNVSIPMRHGVESLNVAAAAAVVLFEAARQRSTP